MRKTFLLWLLAVICTTFIATGALVFFQFAKHARERAEMMMDARLNDMLELFLHAGRSTDYLNRVNVSSTLDRTRALAEIIRLRPAILKNQERLQGVCNRLGAEGLSITDENGTIIAAVPASLVGKNLAESDDTIPFLRCVSSLGYELSQRSLSREVDQIDLQHAAVHRLDSPGVVMLSFRMRVEQEAREADSLSRLTANLRLGTNGRIFVFRDGALISGESSSVSPASLLALPANRALELTIDHQDYYAYAVDGDSYRLVGAIPAQRVYEVGFRSMYMLLVSNLILFAIMFALVWYLLQRLVVRSISRVNESLRVITDGNLNERVDVENSPEFARLSNGINFMVESVKALGEEKRQRMNHDLELARSIQSSVLPNRFPAFPDITAFDLHATCLPSEIVGGDFYDFFLSSDGKKLSFLVADLDATGVPAALFMMRAISIIRMLARAGKSPVELVSQLNKDLCRGNKAGIGMALFFGTLEIETGVLDYVNAGGLHALVQRVGEEYELMPCYTSALIAEREDTQFYTAAMRLEPEDRIYLYTEGVVYASNAAKTPFGEARLQEALRADAPTVSDVTVKVLSALRLHCGSNALQKDVTMFCLEYRGALGNIISLNFTAGQPDEADKLLTEHLESLLVAPVEIADMQHSLKTVLAALPPEQEVMMDLDCTEELGRISLSWDGPEQNPLPTAPALPVERAHYEHLPTGENKVTLQKKFS